MSSAENEQFALTSERAALENFLDAQREGLIRKIQGLDDSTARRAPQPQQRHDRMSRSRAS
jgi:hypothetical protein